MPELNKDRIFNGSDKKVLIREYTSLKKDYSKLGAMKYKELYENASLSFILENSRYIFSEPIKGCEFYKNIMEHAVIPFDKIREELEKVSTYYQENAGKMSDEQVSMYNDLVVTVESVFEKNKNSIRLYEGMMENTSNMTELYDCLYEYMNDKNLDYSKDYIVSVIENATPSDMMDILRVSTYVTETQTDIFTYLESCYTDKPSTTDEYKLNAYTANVLSRMVADKPFVESVNKLSNMNTRHLILGLGGQKNSELLESVTTVVEKNYDTIYSNPINSINRIFEDNMYSDVFEETYDEEKIYRLTCEKEIAKVNLGFLIIDEMTSDDDEFCRRDSIVEKICVESTEIESIPTTYHGQIDILEKYINKLEQEINVISEKYFSADGSPSAVVSASIGNPGNDIHMTKDPEKEQEVYTPSNNHKKDDKKQDDTEKDEEDESDDKLSKDDKEAKKREEEKKRKTEKYASMDIDHGELNSINDIGIVEASDDIEKPEKKPFFQRVQNKALDTNVKFKRKVANGRRTATDARNAGKAVAKIPMNVTSSIKKTVDDYEEMDDNRRKAYMIKPGNRKKYFKMLRLAILHRCAWAINPLLNIVLAICHKFSADKDIRIRNELTRELDTEIKVCEEKIEDAKGKGDNQQKYKLMRIKAKLEAEKARVGNNSSIL